VIFTQPIHEHGDPSRPGPYPHGDGAASLTRGKNPAFDAALDWVQRHYSGPYPLPTIVLVDRKSMVKSRQSAHGYYDPETRTIFVKNRRTPLDKSMSPREREDVLEVDAYEFVDTITHELSHFEDHMKAGGGRGRFDTAEGIANGAGFTWAQKFRKRAR